MRGAGHVVVRPSVHCMPGQWFRRLSGDRDGAYKYPQRHGRRHRHDRRGGWRLASQFATGCFASNLPPATRPVSDCALAYPLATAVAEPLATRGAAAAPAAAIAKSKSSPTARGAVTVAAAEPPQWPATFAGTAARGSAATAVPAPPAVTLSPSTDAASGASRAATFSGAARLSQAVTATTVAAAAAAKAARPTHPFGSSKVAATLAATHEAACAQPAAAATLVASTDATTPAAHNRDCSGDDWDVHVLHYEHDHLPAGGTWIWEGWFDWPREHYASPLWLLPVHAVGRGHVHV